MKRLLFLFTLIVVSLPSFAATVLTNASPATGFINAGETLDFEFTGSVGDHVFLRFKESAVSNGLVYIYNPDGSLLASSSANKLSNIELTNDGTHEVLIKLFNVSHTSDYELHYFTSVGDSEKGNLVSGSTSLDTLTTYDLDSYEFTGSIDDTVFLSFKESAVSNGLVYIYNPDGSLLASNSTNQLSNIELTNDGVYKVLILLYNIGQSSDYELHYFNSTGSTENGQLIDESVVSDTFYTYDFDTYYFTGDYLDTVYLQLDENSSAKGQIYVFHRDGYLVESGNGSVSLTLQEGAWYNVLVRLSSKTKTSDYTLYYETTPFFP